MSLRAQARHEAADDRFVLAPRDLVGSRKLDDQQEPGENGERRADPHPRDDVSSEQPAEVHQSEIDENRKSDRGTHEQEPVERPRQQQAAAQCVDRKGRPGEAKERHDRRLGRRSGERARVRTARVPPARRGWEESPRSRRRRRARATRAAPRRKARGRPRTPTEPPREACSLSVPGSGTVGAEPRSGRGGRKRVHHRELLVDEARGAFGRMPAAVVEQRCRVVGPRRRHAATVTEYAHKHDKGSRVRPRSYDARRAQKVHGEVASPRRFL